MTDDDRKKRNRESAAESRKRQKRYIEELKQKVDILSRQIVSLEKENAAMRDALAAEPPPVAVAVDADVTLVSGLEDVFDVFNDDAWNEH